MSSQPASHGMGSVSSRRLLGPAHPPSPQKSKSLSSQQKAQQRRRRCSKHSSIELYGQSTALWIIKLAVKLQQDAFQSLKFNNSAHTTTTIPCYKRGSLLVYYSLPMNWKLLVLSGKLILDWPRALGRFT